MSNPEAITNDPLLNADACGNHKVELENVQLQQELLGCAIAAQEKLTNIRAEYSDLRSLVYRIRELKAGEEPSRFQRSLVDNLIHQQESVDHLATSLTRILE